MPMYAFKSVKLATLDGVKRLREFGLLEDLYDIGYTADAVYNACYEKSYDNLEQDWDPYITDEQLECLCIDMICNSDEYAVTSYIETHCGHEQPHRTRDAAMQSGSNRQVNY